jgi:hypothetical protein
MGHAKSARSYSYAVIKNHKHIFSSLTASLLIFIGLVSANAAAYSKVWDTNADWNTGTLTNTSVANGSVSLAAAGSPAPSAALRMNAGGGAFTDPAGNAWSADNYFTGGTTNNQAAGHAISGTSNPALYQDERYGAMQYNVPLANGTYSVRLHFAEIYSGCQSVGCRIFNVSVNGSAFLNNFDIYSKVGGYAADTETTTATVTNGMLNINFTKVKENPQITGIQIAQSTSQMVLAAATTVRINTGGGSVTDSSGNVWAADNYFTGGNTDNQAVGRTISGTSTPSLYQDERWGNSTYNIPIPNGTYDVRLHFAEIYQPCFFTGCRLFNVNVNGSRFLTNFDIYSEVGANAADIKMTTATVSSGNLAINFAAVKQNPEVVAIEVIPSGSPTTTTTQPAPPVTTTTTTVAPTTTTTRATTTTTAPPTTAYVPSGNIVLNFDAGAAVDWASLLPQSTLPSGTSISFQMRTSNDNASWSAWNSNVSSLANSRYIQIQALLSTTVNTSTPTLDSLTLGYDPVSVTTTTTAPTTTTTAAPTTTTTRATTTTTAPPTTTTTTTANYRSAVMADSPVAYWRFANTNSETGSHNGSLRGSPAPQLGQPGPFAGSQSIRFDGVLRDNATTGGFLANSLGRLSSSTWSNGFTLEAWAKTTTDGPEQHVMTWSDAIGNAGPGILFDDPDNVWKYRDGTISLSMNGTTTINAWHYLVASVDGSGNGKLYVDGVQVQSWNSGVRPIAASDGLFTVGADYDAHGCPCPAVDTPFNGWIAEAAVYNHPLSQTRVQAHFVAR